ncbi:MAG: glycosyltransferase family 9 protein [Pseudomonadota bacterium]
MRAIGFDNPYSGYIVVHSGCGGSALNWRFSYYAELASRLSESTGLAIILTGSDKENSITSSIKQHVRGKCFNTAGLFSLKELVAVISEAKLFIGPSTGPMHIAAACAVPLVSIFSPVRVQSARRWGPYSKNSIVISPRVTCPAKLKCLGDRCESYNCMDMVSIDDIFEKSKKLYDDSVQQFCLFQGA